MSNTQTMQIFTIINKIEQAIEDSPRPKLGGNAKRIVDVDELFDLLGDLKVTIPEDIRRANTVLLEAENMVHNASEHAQDLVADAQDQSDAMLRDAQNQSDTMLRDASSQANKILDDAQTQFEQRVAEHEILQEAQKRAELLERKAEHNATVVYEGAKRYADDILVDLTRFLGEYQTLIQKNRDELDVRREPDLTVAQPAAAQSKPAAAAQAAEKTQPTPARPAAAQVQPKAAPKPVAAPAMIQNFATEAAAPQPNTSVESEEDDFLEEEHPVKRNWWKRKDRREDFYEFDEEEDEYDDDEGFESEEEAPKKRWSLFKRRELDEDIGLDEDE